MFLNNNFLCPWASDGGITSAWLQFCLRGVYSCCTQPVWPGRHPGRFGWISYLPTFDSLCLISWPTFHTSFRCGIWAGIPGSCCIPGAPWTSVWPCQEHQPLGEGAGRPKCSLLSQEQWASPPSLGCSVDFLLCPTVQLCLLMFMVIEACWVYYLDFCCVLSVFLSLIDGHIALLVFFQELSASSICEKEQVFVGMLRPCLYPSSVTRRSKCLPVPRWCRLSLCHWLSQPDPMSSLFSLISAEIPRDQLWPAWPCVLQKPWNAWPSSSQTFLSQNQTEPGQAMTLWIMGKEENFLRKCLGAFSDLKGYF